MLGRSFFNRLSWLGEHAGRGAIFAALLLAGCANQAFHAYEVTPVFGESREIVRENNHYAYRFAYRGGTVTYRPETGAEWLGDARARKDDSPPTALGRGKDAASLPNGCLVFACARAEEIRGKPSSNSHRSQVIGYTRSDGSGHAFVVFEKSGIATAEDDRGHVLAMPAWKHRSPAEALTLAEVFQRGTHPAGFPRPIRASFIGEF